MSSGLARRLGIPTARVIKREKREAERARRAAAIAAGTDSPRPKGPVSLLLDVPELELLDQLVIDALIAINLQASTPENISKRALVRAIGKSTDRTRRSITPRAYQENGGALLKLSYDEFVALDDLLDAVNDETSLHTKVESRVLEIAALPADRALDNPVRTPKHPSAPAPLTSRERAEIIALRTAQRMGQGNHRSNRRVRILADELTDELEAVRLEAAQTERIEHLERLLASVIDEKRTLERHAEYLYSRYANLRVRCGNALTILAPMAAYAASDLPVGVVDKLAEVTLKLRGKVPDADC